MLSLLQSPLGFASMPDDHYDHHPEQNPCHDMIKHSSLNTVVGDIAANAEQGKVVNLDCFKDATEAAFAPQAGANVTAGFTGMVDTTGVYVERGSLKAAGMCAVNVHWHEGAEHLSVGEYDEHGSGPGLGHNGYYGPGRRLAGGGQTQGHECHHYASMTEAQKQPYHWEHCKNMHVGETYEVHWPHSAAGACGTKWQFQSPFYDGVLCNDAAVLSVYEADNELKNMGQYVGVEGQVFTIVNDPAYDANLGLAGAIKGGDFWQDVAIYSGSTTGQSRDNQLCSAYSPVTWQVDRKCHMISAKSFDMLCAQMQMQADDPNDGHDLEPHGSRLTVSQELTATNINGGNRA